MPKEGKDDEAEKAAREKVEQELVRDRGWSPVWRRPLVAAVLVFGAGIAAGAAIGVPAGWPACATVACALLVLVRRREDRAGTVFVLVAVFLAGVAYCSLRSGLAAATLEPGVGKLVQLEGTVVSEPQRTKDGCVFAVRVRGAAAEGRTVQARGTVQVAVSLADGEEPPAGYAADVAVCGLLRRPAPATNPGQHDPQRALRARGIRHIMYARPEAVRVTGRRIGNPVVRAGLVIKRWALGAATAGLSAEQAALLTGIMFGGKSGLSDSLREAFSRVGVAHVTAVSGLHVGFVAAACFGLLRLCRVRGAPGAAAASLCVLLYCAAVGFSASALRAAIMLWAVLAATALGRAHDSPTALALAAGVILVANPFSLFDLAFQLSFAATAGILLLSAPLGDVLGWLPGGVRRLAATTAAAQLAVMPLCAAEFNTVSLLSFAVNLLAVPLAGAAVNLGFLSAALTPLAAPLGRLAAAANGFLLDFLGAVVRVASQLPLCYLYIPAPRAWTVIAYYAALVTALGVWRPGAAGPGRWRRAGALALCLVFLSWVAPVALPRRHLEVTFLDVGMGDAIYVAAPGAPPLLIDGGGGAEGTGAGARVVVPFLRSRGVRRLDVMVTHGHDDHAGGILAVLDSFRVSTAYVSPHRHDSPAYQELLAEFGARGVRIRELCAGQSLQRGGVDIRVIHPPRPLPPGTEANNNSVVLILGYGLARFVLAADVEAEGIDRLLASGVDVRACVLKVPHHGSGNSFHLSFLARVSPRYAVISVGENRFGHPAAGWLEALEARAVAVYRTDIHGAVSFLSDGASLRVRKFRRG